MPEAVPKRPKLAQLPTPQMLIDLGESEHETSHGRPDDGMDPQIACLAADSLKVHDYSRLNARGSPEGKSPSPTRNKDRHKRPHCSKCQRMMELSGNPKFRPSMDASKQSTKSAQDDRVPFRGADAKTAISTGLWSKSSPMSNYGNNPSPQSKAHKQQLRPKDDHSAKHDTHRPLQTKRSRKEEDTADSNSRSEPSISPRSAHDKSKRDWEDRFVVNMPSAREPSPPTMSTQQIRDYQRSLGKLYSDESNLADPETTITPRITTTETTDCPRTKQEVGRRPSPRQGSAPLLEAVCDPSKSPQRVDRYYSAEDVGKHGSGRNAEDSPLNPKSRAQAANTDGSFLGCLDVNRPDLKSPDEILLFPNMDENSSPLGPCVLTPKRSKEILEDSSPVVEAKATIRGEFAPISQSLRSAQCSKSPKTMCQQTECKWNLSPTQVVKISGKENVIPAASPISPWSSNKENFEGDGAYTIIPTTTYTVDVPDVAEMMDTSKKERQDTQQRQPRTDDRVRATIRIKASARTGSSSQPQSAISPEQSSGRSMMCSDALPTQPISTTRKRSCMRPTQASVISISQTGPLLPAANSTTPTMPVSDNEFTSLDSTPVDSGKDPIAMPDFLKPQNLPARSFSWAKAIPSLDGAGKSKGDESGGVQPRRIPRFTELDGQQMDNHQDEIFFSHIPGISTRLPAADTPIDSQSVRELHTLSLIFDIFLLSAANAKSIFWSCATNTRGKIALDKVLNMIGHCLHVSRRIFAAMSIYRSTGAWPKQTGEENLVQFLREIAEAVMYLVTLGLVLSIVGRAAGYIVLVGSWAIWLVKPVSWVLAQIGRVFLE